MQKQRTIRKDEEAVSPVIGVILMVAITVVLAAVVFVLVSDMGGDTQDQPKASFQTDKSGAGGDIRIVKISNGPIAVSDVTATGGTCQLKDAGGTNKTTGNLAAGDYWDCAADGSVSIVHTATDTLLYRDDI